MVLICISTFLHDNLNYFIIFANLSYLFTSADLLFTRVWNEMIRKVDFSNNTTSSQLQISLSY